jgi:rhamnogalacturonan acetylesterase
LNGIIIVGMLKNLLVVTAVMIFLGFAIGIYAVAAESSATQPDGDKANIPTLWLIGDSTVKNGQDRGGLGQWGWGHPLTAFFDLERIRVENRALGGTSSRTFQTRDNWPRVLADFKAGDYLIMQFGHNDGDAVNDNSRARGSLPGNGEETQAIDNLLTGKHEIVHTYGWYLRKFVADAKAKGAAAVIVCSPIPRNIWADGKITPNAKYTLWASQAAKDADAYFVDLNEIIGEKYDALGQTYVTDKLFPKDEHTHPDWAGAVLNAQCVVDGIKSLEECDLKNYLLPNPPAQLAEPATRPTSMPTAAK